MSKTHFKIHNGKFLTLIFFIVIGIVGCNDDEEMIDQNDIIAEGNCYPEEPEEIFAIASVPAKIQNFTEVEFEQLIMQPIEKYLPQGISGEVRMVIFYSIEENSCLLSLESNIEIDAAVFSELQEEINDKIIFVPVRPFGDNVNSIGKTNLAITNGLVNSIEHLNYEFN